MNQYPSIGPTGYSEPAYGSNLTLGNSPSNMGKLIGVALVAITLIIFSVLGEYVDTRFLTVLALPGTIILAAVAVGMNITKKPQIIVQQVTSEQDHVQNMSIEEAREEVRKLREQMRNQNGQPANTGTQALPTQALSQTTP